MLWIPLGVGLLFAAILLFYILRATVVVFWLHLFQVRPVLYLEPAPPDDPEWAKLDPRVVLPRPPDDPNPYASPAEVDYATCRLAALAGLGFKAAGLFVHKSRPRYQLHIAPHETPDRRCLAVLIWGKVLRFPSNYLLLYTPLADGRFVVSCEQYLGLDPAGIYILRVLLNATVDQLLARHWSTVAETEVNAVPFATGDPRVDYERTLSLHAENEVALKRLSYSGPERTHVRSTLRGALRAYRGVWVVPSYVERLSSDGEPVPLRRPPRRRAPRALRTMLWSFLAVGAGSALAAVLLGNATASGFSLVVALLGMLASASILGFLLLVLILIVIER